MWLIPVSLLLADALGARCPSGRERNRAATTLLLLMGKAKPSPAADVAGTSLRQACVEDLAWAVRQRPLWALLCGYMLFGAWFIAIVPPDGAPDQAAHIIYVEHVAAGNGLPVLGESPSLYEAHQPPLFYLLCTPIYLAGSYGGRDVAIVLMRVFCLLCGATGIIFTAAIARRILPTRPETAIFACTLSALLPMHIFINASVNSDNLGEALCTVMLLPLVALPCAGRLGWRSALLCGVGVGLAILSKMTALMLLPTLAVALALHAHRTRSWREDVRWGLLALALCATVCGWWFGRNVVIYGGPLGTEAYKAYFEGSPNVEWFAERGIGVGGYSYVVATYMFKTFWGLFGNTDIPVSSGLYWAFGVVSVLITIGALRFLWSIRQGKELDDVRRGALAVSLVFFGCIVLTHLQYLTIFLSAQMRHWYPAIAPMMLLMAVGTLTWVPSRLRPRAYLVAAGFLVGYSLICLVGYVWPAFAASN